MDLFECAFAWSSKYLGTESSVQEISKFFLGGSILHVGSTVPGTLAAALTRSWTYLGIFLDPFPTGSIAMYLLSWLSPASAIEGQRWACVHQISRLKNNPDRALEDWGTTRYVWAYGQHIRSTG